MYLGVQGLMPDDLGEVTEATMARVREHGFTGVAALYFESLSATKESVTRLRYIMEAGGVDPCQARLRRTRTCWRRRLRCVEKAYGQCNTCAV